MYLNVMLSCLLCFSFFAVQAQSEEVASIARTTCYGQCPYYKIKIYSDGLLIYEGKKNVANLGIHRARISKDSVELILQRAEAINYFQLNEKYPNKGIGMIDLPVCITRIKKGLTAKTIWNRNDAPIELIRFERFIDELLAEVNWKQL